MKKTDSQVLLATDLESEYGKSITPQELGKFLGIDDRTVVNYATV